VIFVQDGQRRQGQIRRKEQQDQDHAERNAANHFLPRHCDALQIDRRFRLLFCVVIAPLCNVQSLLLTLLCALLQLHDFFQQRDDSCIIVGHKIKDGAKGPLYYAFGLFTAAMSTTIPVPALEVLDLKKTYASGVEALKGISLTVQAGDFYALLGPNGAGKSTLIGVISSLVNATSGAVNVFGVPIRTRRSDAMQLIGLVPQEFNFNLFETPFDICTNQAGFYGVERKVALVRAEKYLKQLSLWDKAHSVTRTLSGGMKRRLMIARAMMNEPKLLILDEPTAGVDIEIRRSMWKFIEAINAAGTTVILTTHYLEEAESLCRNITIIDHGRIIENTSMRNLLSKLDVETFVLDVRVDSSGELPTLVDVKLTRIDERTVEAEMSRAHDLNSLFAALSARGITVTSMRNKANRLEELFVRLIENGAANGRKAAA
jgi:ABC-2 type transport system ATP-binding protein